MVATAVLAAAPQAHADDAAYLNLLTNTWVYQRLGPDVLVSEGHKVCDSFAQGGDFSQANDMVRADLNVPVITAEGIVTAASEGLGCWP